jgi:tRNA dimethylallyltransferase
MFSSGGYLDIKNKPKIVVISGITGAGKTALSVELARKFNGEIVSCDSRQVYKYCDIATAKITKEEMKGVSHYMLDVADPTKNERYSAAEFARDANECIADILSRGKLPILAGGTGLYTRAVIEGYTFDNALKNGRHREIITDTATKLKNRPKYNVLQICLIPPREKVAPQIMRRIEDRLNNGMIQETKELIKKGVTEDFLLNLGLEYYWNVKYINGEVTIEEYKTQLFNKTMQFIKRQRTWYRKESPKYTYYLDEPKEYANQAANLILQFLNKPR